MTELLETDPGNDQALLFLSVAESFGGRVKEALETTQHMVDVTQGIPLAIVMQAITYALDEQQDKARELLDDLEQKEATDFIPKYFRAIIHRCLGDIDKALALYDENLEELTFPFLVNLRVNYYGDLYPLLRESEDALMADPRYWALIERAGYPPLPPEHPLYKYEQAWLLKKSAQEVLDAQPKLVRRYSITLDPAYPIARTFFSAPEHVEMSLDNQTIDYVTDAGGTNRIMARPLDREEAKPVRGSDGASFINLSPDGTRFAFWSRGSVWILPVKGGIPREIFSAYAIGVPAVWSNNQTLIGTLRNSKLARIDIHTGESVPLLPADEYPGIVQLGWSMDYSQQLLSFGVLRGTEVVGFTSYILDLDSSQITHIADGALATFSPTGHIVLLGGPSHSVSAYDAEQGKLVGPTLELQEKDLIGSLISFENAGGNDMYYIASSETSEPLQELVWVDVDSTETPTGVQPMNFMRVCVFGTGSQLRVAATNILQEVIWIGNGHGPLRVFTFEHQIAEWPLWSPDGKDLFYSGRLNRTSTTKLYKKSSDMLEEPVEVAEGIESIGVGIHSWTPDGKTIIGDFAASPESGYLLTAIHLDEDGRIETLTTSDKDQFFTPQLSPNGRWLACSSLETGKSNIFVRSWPELTVVGQISTEGGREPVWAADGSALYFRGPTHMMEVSIHPTENFGWDEPKPLFEDQYAKSPVEPFVVSNYGFDATAIRFLMPKPLPGITRPTEIRIIENWGEEIEQRFAEEEGK